MVYFAVMKRVAAMKSKDCTEGMLLHSTGLSMKMLYTIEQKGNMNTIIQSE